MNAKCRRVENLALVVIDYLQLMQSAVPDERQREPPADRLGYLALS
jgi:replicative DNA helicase